MKHRKRLIAAMLALLTAAGLLTGCGTANRTESASSELFTGDPDAIRIFIWGNSDHMDILPEKFPDIKFDFYEYNGMNISSSMAKLLERDELGDIHINSLQVTADVAQEHLMDLSGMSVCSKYEPSMLNQYDIDGGIYQLPGSVSVRCILYNKDMFEENGWKEPQNFDELAALCRQIREETSDITPIVMGGAACGYYFTTMTTFSQCEYLYTPEGADWAKKYAAGEASAAKGFGTGLEMMQELIDARAFDYEKNQGLWDLELFQKRMDTGEAAMMFLWGSQDAIATEIENSSTEYAVMPFRKRDGTAFLSNTVSYNISLSKELEEKGNEKKLEDAKRVLDWLSSGEGIYAITNDSSTSIFPLKDEGNPLSFKLYQDLWTENKDCIKAPMLYAGYEDILIPAGEAIMEAVRVNGTLDDIADLIDKIHQEYLQGGSEAIQVGSFTRDFTHQETLQLLAEVMQEKGSSDISMVSDGIVKDGVSNNSGGHLNFYKGALMEEYLSCTIPGNNQLTPCVQMTLTGAQIRKLVEKGKHVVMRGDSKSGYYLDSAEDAIASGYFDYYWAGMDVKMKDGKVSSMTLDDGREITDDESYTVTFAPTDYTDGVEASGNPVELDFVVNDALRSYMKAHSPVSPPKVCR